MSRAHRVGILVFDGVTMLDVSGPADVLGKAGAFGGNYEVTLVAPAAGTVRAAGGLLLAGAARAHGAGPFDTAIVAGGDRLATEPIEAELLEAARALVAGAGRVASVCTGAFLLAALGELDGRRATTHWRHTRRLAAAYPAVDVQPDAIFVADGRVVTSAGVSAGIDLALMFVERDHGAEVAREVARELVVFLRRPGGQSQFSTAGRTPVPTRDSLRELMAAVVADPGGEHTLESMAHAVAMSPRNLARVFRREIGTTPTRWVESVRLEAAQRLLLDGHGVGVAARRSGLGSDESLRRVFARHLGVTPSEYRQRFLSADRSEVLL